MIFFRPTKKWIDWLIGYANGRIIVDIGCGEGLLIKKLSEAGYNKVMGVDLLISDELKCDCYGKGIHLLEIDTLSSTFNRIFSSINHNMLFIFCRPCHGWWVEMTINNLPKNADVLYVGLEENLPRDINVLSHTSMLLDAPEKTWKIESQAGDSPV